jgi:hypothetical protein
MLFASVLVLIPLLAVSLNSFIAGRDGSLYLLLLLSAYSIYVAYSIFQELKIYKLDKKNGIEEAILKFDSFKVHFKSTRDNMPPIPIALFSFCNSNATIALRGDYRGVRLVKGKKYNVRFYRYSRIMVEIKEP